MSGWAVVRRSAVSVRYVPMIVLALGFGACDSGPQGPGALVGRVAAPSLGGVVLEVEGRGIRGFAGRGEVRVYSAAIEGRPTAHRVLLIEPRGGEIVFEIQVDDRGMDGPSITPIVATQADNQPLSVSQLSLRVER